MSEQGRWVSGIIETPEGDYHPQSDDLLAELQAAARFAGLRYFTVFLNGEQVPPGELPVEFISELTLAPRIAPYNEVA